MATAEFESDVNDVALKPPTAKHAHLASDTLSTIETTSAGADGLDGTAVAVADEEAVAVADEPVSDATVVVALPQTPDYNPAVDGGRGAPNRWSHGIDWPVVAWIVIVHAGALAAPFFFTWKALALAAGLAWLTGSIGVCMGYHRQLTHGSFCTYRPMRWLFALLGGLSGEGSALMWVANHRKHHMFSDKEGDPHSPRDGSLWSHILWFMPKMEDGGFNALVERYAPDLSKDRGMRVLHYGFLPSHIILSAILFAIGYFGWNAYTGMSFVVWGMFVRLIYVLHVTWLVNSASHIWGYRNYETTDDSRNLWWVGLLAFGEGWHNNHHAYQRMARQGHKWWEVDVTYWAICLLEKVGLVWNVVHEVPKNQKPA